MFGIKLGKRRAEVRKYTSEMIYRSIRNKNKDTDQNLLAKLFWDDVRNNCVSSIILIKTQVYVV